MTKKKREALTVNRLINEVLVKQLNIPLKQIVNDTTFQEYTGSKRPDLLISEVEFDKEKDNEEEFIENVVAYAEVKDNCSVDDADWKDAIEQGHEKAKILNLPYFIVTNCKKTIFYNKKTNKEITLNGSPIREFQPIDILRLIKNCLSNNPELQDIQTNVDSVSTISEAIFNKKLWELAQVYRGINFDDNIHKIDFTIGFIALEYFEEKQEEEAKKDDSKIYWSECESDKSEQVVANLARYIRRLENDPQFSQFTDLMGIVRKAISGKGEELIVDKRQVVEIYEIVDSMSPLHGCGFDLFGAVYEKFASSKEKQDFGEYFTRRPYAHIFSKLLLKDEQYFNSHQKFKILDPACGTGGFLTESFKVLKSSYKSTDTYTQEAKEFLANECFYGVDVRSENVTRTKLNMFLVGDGHTNMRVSNSLKDDYDREKFDYVITNPPYGDGTIEADTGSISTTRYEIAFFSKIMKLLKVGGRACVITPDGLLENPSYTPFRKEILEKCNIDAIVSLPKFAFAPYTKEKTYAVFFTKRSKTKTKIQDDPIWIYIIDHDGLANSDKRFPTKLRNNKNGWKHDEISGWVSTDGEEKTGKLESRWMEYDDSNKGGTEWVDVDGKKRKERKAGFINISKIKDDEFYTLLPEYYLRPYEPDHITLPDLKDKIAEVRSEVNSLADIELNLQD